MNFALRITLNGKCAEAVKFYSEVFGIAPAEYFTFGDKRDLLGGVQEDKSHYVYSAILNISGNPGLCLVLGDTPALLFQDDPVPYGFGAMQHTTIEITDSDPDVIRGIFGQLMRNGKANKEIGETPEYKLFGSLIDGYGVLWNLYCI